VAIAVPTSGANGARAGRIGSARRGTAGVARSFEGFYGQLNLADFRREWIHAPMTTYSVIFNLRYDGVVNVQYYSAFGWY
jgi:hypothetical protein